MEPAEAMHRQQQGAVPVIAQMIPSAKSSFADVARVRAFVGGSSYVDHEIVRFAESPKTILTNVPLFGSVK